MVLLLASAWALEPLDLTPTGGVEDCEDEPDFVQKGYTFVVDKPFRFYAVEWKVALPEGSYATWQLYDVETYPGGTGEVIEGDGELGWRESAWSDPEGYLLGKGRWTLAFVHDAPETAQYCRKVGVGVGTHDVVPHLLEVTSVSGTTTHQPPDTTNSSPPYIRFVLDPEDGDGDGVADLDDNCPDDANEDQADEDGDGKGDACDRCYGRDGSGDADGDEHCWKLEDDTVWDCDDEDSSVHPLATDLCGDGVDQDCSGSDEPCPDSGDSGDSRRAPDSPADSATQDSSPPTRTPQVDEESLCSCTTGSAALLILGLLLAGTRRRAR